MILTMYMHVSSYARILMNYVIMIAPIASYAPSNMKPWSLVCLLRVINTWKLDASVLIQVSASPLNEESRTSCFNSREDSEYPSYI